MSSTARSVRALSLHADYACRHSGACCTAGWTIPVEPARQSHFGVPVLVPDEDGACGHYDRDARRCRVHRDHGVDHLPTSCQQFPRRALIDDRGTFITLSHFCPTAAALLFRRDRPLAIDTAPSAFPHDAEYEGLDARGAWPPLIRPGLLFDWTSYDAWEQLLVSTFADDDLTPRAALSRIASAAEHIRRWTPGDGALGDGVQAASSAVDGDALQIYAAFDQPGVYLGVTRTVPAGLEVPQLPTNALATAADLPDRWNRPIRAYRAPKAFAAGCAYQAHGVRTLVAELVATLLVLRIEVARLWTSPPGDQVLLEAIRSADWLLMHLSDRDQLTRWLGTVETR